LISDFGKPSRLMGCCGEELVHRGLIPSFRILSFKETGISTNLAAFRTLQLLTSTAMTNKTGRSSI